jgi:DNA-binding NarL/FixJ family response regulator
VKQQALRVEVQANGSLRPRILAVLAATDVAVVSAGAHPGPDIEVVAHDLSRPSSLGRLRLRLAQGAARRVVVVSPGCGALGVRRAVRAGADSLVLEQELDTALVPALQAVAAGLTAWPSVLQNGINGLAFSHREREVLRLAIDGNTNGQIATTLFLAESTVKSHLSSAYRKLGANSRKDAASLLLDPEEGLGDIVLGRGP